MQRYLGVGTGDGENVVGFRVIQSLLRHLGLGTCDAQKSWGSGLIACKASKNTFSASTVGEKGTRNTNISRIKVSSVKNNEQHNICQEKALLMVES